MRGRRLRVAVLVAAGAVLSALALADSRPSLAVASVAVALTTSATWARRYVAPVDAAAWDVARFAYAVQERWELRPENQEYWFMQLDFALRHWRRLAGDARAGRPDDDAPLVQEIAKAANWTYRGQVEGREAWEVHLRTLLAAWAAGEGATWARAGREANESTVKAEA